MLGEVGVRDEATGVHINTTGCHCDTCKCDLYLSAVVSAMRPGVAVCPEHAQNLGVPASTCVLLYR